ncbi:MAG: PorV/PorQ family protein [candidate division Zixibacteria bacterium]|nr:PorV/PorQ family protein [candidate division Zixibacteria bacterium]
MKNRIAIFTVVLLALSLSSAFAGNPDRLGTAGALELTIPYGSRGTAMGGAVVSSAYGVESMYWNPAGLASLEGTEAMFTHLPYIADIDVNYIGAATTIEDFGTIGAGAKVVSIGDIEETTEDYPDGTGRVYNPSLTVLNLTYSRILTVNVSFGVSAMFISEQVQDVSASGVAFDVGFMYDPGWRGLRLGLSVKNYGPEMKFAGSGFQRSLDGDRPAQPEAASFDLPSSFNVGMSYDFLDTGDNYASLSGTFKSNSYGSDSWKGGFEYAYKGMYFLRGGYTFEDQEEYLYGMNLGAGLVYAMGDTKLTFEYSWNDTEVFDDNQYFTVKFNF